MSIRADQNYKLQEDEMGAVVNNQYNHFAPKTSIVDIHQRIKNDFNGENLIMFVFILFVAVLFFSFLYFQV